MVCYCLLIGYLNYLKIFFLILVEDLGFDSLAMMMMAMELEDAFDFKFTEFVKFETVGDVCYYLESRI